MAPVAGHLLLEPIESIRKGVGSMVSFLIIVTADADTCIRGVGSNMALLAPQFATGSLLLTNRL